MSNSRPKKDRKRPWVLDSSLAMRKRFGRLPTKSVPVAPKPAAYSPPEFVATEREPRMRPPMSADWQLATDPTNLSDGNRPRDRAWKERPAKIVERKQWAWAARLERLERASRAEKSEWMERAQTSRKVEPPAVVEPQKPPKPKIVKRKKVCDRKSQQPSPTGRRRKVQSSLSFRSCRPGRNVLVVEAKSTTRVEKRPVRQMAGSSASALPFRQREAVAQHKLRMVGRSRKHYGVPLCSPITVDMPHPNSRQVQMRQQQLFQQPEYQDQYKLMLQQQLHQLQQQQRQFGSSLQSIDRSGGMSESSARELHQPYSVPAKSRQQRLKSGKKLCGNFYYG
ncbi:hypothetical protein KR009_003186 [Drosophila setifemur]|nr:hypothetical protein KR009_003186 [Drosophila setifemur]